MLEKTEGSKRFRANAQTLRAPEADSSKALGPELLVVDDTVGKARH
jgi:hypothetical protein